MNFPLDISIDKEPFQYVINIIKGKGDPYISPDSMVRIFPSMIKLTMPDDALFIFQERYNSGEIPCQYRYEDYIADKDLQATIKGLNLDPDAFWLLVMFCLDYACDVCFSGYEFADSVGEQIAKLLSVLSDEKDSSTQISAKAGRNKIIISNKQAISKIREWVKVGYESEKASLNLPAINDFSELVKESEESNSVLIWYFASLLRYFFEINPQYKGRAKKCTTVSLNKNILISNLIYYTRLSLNPNFLNDDEALKGFFKQYKGKEIKARSGIYPSL